MVKDIKIEDYDYNLPEGRIALHPLEERDACKLLLRAPNHSVFHRKFKELPALLPPGSLLICNNTKVIKARLGFHKDTGAAIELFLLEPLTPSDYALNFQQTEKCRWKCLVGNSKKWKEGEIHTEVPVGENDNLILKARRLKSYEDGSSEIEFSWQRPEFTFSRIIDLTGNIPIPPYLNRESEESDIEDYQTVYAREQGSVAAPTAGLHFTSEVFENLKAHAITKEEVTLHVGAGTFRPVKSKNIGDHAMHSEPFSVSRRLINSILEARQQGRKVVATGTTTVRTLESLPYIGMALQEETENPFHITQWVGYKEELQNRDTEKSLDAILSWMDKNNTDTLNASTSIMIAPGFKWRITDCMVTNFHQPKSTLLLLVSSFLGNNDWKELYEEALKNDYRFLSYGDACLLLR